jgi:hypothetical protein
MAGRRSDGEFGVAKFNPTVFPQNSPAAEV